MSVILGDNQYGKAETRVVRVTKREDGSHELTDLNVSVALAGDFAAAHVDGDNRNVVPTDTQKNTVFAFAAETPIGEIEDFGLRLARHFVADFPQVERARVTIASYPWARIPVDGEPHPHAFVRSGSEKRVAVVTACRAAEWVVAGIDDLVVLKSSGSEFWGFARDRYTTLAETHDRILATAVAARWRYAGFPRDWARAHAEVRRLLLEAFAAPPSLALQQTLYGMGKSVLESCREVAEVKLSMPNRHHFAVDLGPFGLANENEVFFAADRPYGLIEGTVTREDAPPPGMAW